MKVCDVCGVLINRNTWCIEICFSTISKKAAHKSPGFLRGFLNYINSIEIILTKEFISSLRSSPIVLKT